MKYLLYLVAIIFLFIYFGPHPVGVGAMLIGILIYCMVTSK